MLTDVHAYLTANGQGTNLYVGHMPPTPDVVAVLYQYAGRPTESTLESTSIKRERPGLQVIVRSSPKAYADAEARAYAILRLLTVANTTLGSGFYQQVEPMASPFLMGRDENGRALIACNYLCSRDWN